MPDTIFKMSKVLTRDTSTDKVKETTLIEVSNLFYHHGYKSIATSKAFNCVYHQQATQIDYLPKEFIKGLEVIYNLDKKDINIQIKCRKMFYTELAKYQEKKNKEIKNE